MEAWLRNGVWSPLEISLSLITRVKAKRFKEAFNVLIQNAHVEGTHMLNFKEETKMIYVIKVNSELSQELGRFFFGVIYRIICC